MPPLNTLVKTEHWSNLPMRAFKNAQRQTHRNISTSKEIPCNAVLFQEADCFLVINNRPVFYSMLMSNYKWLSACPSTELTFTFLPHTTCRPPDTVHFDRTMAARGRNTGRCATWEKELTNTKRMMCPVQRMMGMALCGNVRGRFRWEYRQTTYNLGIQLRPFGSCTKTGSSSSALVFNRV